jgi:putative transposase
MLNQNSNMIYIPDKHHRRSIRLKAYDYSRSGPFFITICVKGRKCLLGKIEKGKIQLNNAGKMIHDWWHQLPKIYPNIELDEFVIMPNHLHGIIILCDNVGAALVDAQNNANSIATQKIIPNVNPDESRNNIHLNNNRAGTRSVPTNIGLGDVIGAFKSITTNEYIKGVQKLNWYPFNKRLWQRNYYEHLIRNDNELNRIREYIIENPLKWDGEDDNSDNLDID